jgi:hypothetical protein
VTFKASEIYSVSQFEPYDKTAGISTAVTLLTLL